CILGANFLISIEISSHISATKHSERVAPVVEPCVWKLRGLRFESSTPHKWTHMYCLLSFYLVFAESLGLP
ncbi:hypothetical protein LINGRAHAP2_LOCUS36062, partial [Linum grandiflorum]